VQSARRQSDLCQGNRCFKMIEEFEKKHSLQVNRLGHTLNEDYDICKRGELEKILVYTKGEDVIGFVQYTKLYEVVEIFYLVVDEKYRCLGIGSAFIDHLARDLDVQREILEVRVSNEGAISFYEKNGFKRLRPIKNYYKNGEDALSMEKVIR